MSDVEQNPLDESQLAEAWHAFAQLARAAEAPFDEAACAVRVKARLALDIERGRRRRRLWIGTGALAAAASLLVIVGLNRLVPREENSPALPLPEQVAPRVAAAPALQGNIADAQAVVVENAQASRVEIAPWEDELAVETASLADELQLVERQWRERPDSIALLQLQIDQFEQEIKSGEL